MDILLINGDFEITFALNILIFIIFSLGLGFIIFAFRNNKKILQELQTKDGYQKYGVRRLFKEYALLNNYLCARDVQFFNNENANDKVYMERFNRDRIKYPSHTNFNNILITDRAIFVEHYLPASDFDINNDSKLILGYKRYFSDGKFKHNSDSDNGGQGGSNIEVYLENPMYYMDYWISLFRQKAKLPKLKNGKEIPIYVGIKEMEFYDWCKINKTYNFDVDNTIVEKGDYTMYFIADRTLHRYESKIIKNSYRLKKIQEFNKKLTKVLSSDDMLIIYENIWNCNEIVFEL